MSAERDALQPLETLGEAIRAVAEAANLDPTATLGELRVRAEVLLGCDAVGIHLAEGPPDEVVFRRVHVSPFAAVRGASGSPPWRPGPDMLATLLRGEAVCFDDFQTSAPADIRRRPWMREFHSGLYAPLTTGDEILGLLFAGWLRPRACEPEVVARATAFARCAAVAVRTARLLDRAQRARVEAEALAAEREAVLGQIADGVVILDRAGQITFANQAARRLHGVAELAPPLFAHERTYALETVEGQPYPRDEFPLAGALRRGEAVANAEWRIRRPDGTSVIVQGSAAPVLGQDGSWIAAVLVLRDVTGARTLDLQREVLLSALSHDLKTPLTTIRGEAQLLQRRLATSGERDLGRLGGGLMRIDAAAARMARMANELLDAVRLHAGQPLELDRRSTDLVALVRRTAEEHRHSRPRSRIRVRAAVSELVGHWDAFRLGRVLDNLLDNAAKYGRPGGTIVITVARERDDAGDWATLAVRDEGIGIPDADLPHVFERFRRGGNVPGRVGGAGIGLAGVRQIVQQHGGEITVQSRQGHGSTFGIRLPLGTPSSDE